VDLDGTYEEMLADTGWKLLQRDDLTPDYLETLQRMVAGLQEESEPLLDLLGEEEFTGMLQRRRRQVGAVERGILLRELYLAEAT
jgi:hypothetical protein